MDANHGTGANLRRLAPVLVIAILLAYAAGSTAYLAAFKVDRERATVVMKVVDAAGSGARVDGLRDDAERLVKAFAATVPGYVVTLVDAGGRPFFSTGAGSGGPLVPDLALGAADSLRPLRPALDVPAFHHALLLAVPFPSALVSVSREEAERAVTDLGAGRPSPWPDLEVEVVDLAGREADRQLLAVDGVYPTLATVLDGSYPLGQVVCFGVREPRGPLGVLGRVPFIRRRIQPNYPAVRDFIAWLRTDQARTAFYGTPFEIRLAAVGDVMLGRNVGRDTAAKGLDWPFGLVADRLSAADITFANLEAPLGTSGTALPGKLIWLRGSPEAVESLKLAGIDVVSLANNHILDYDSPCLLETIGLLDRNGIAHAGAGSNIGEARAPAVLEAGGLKVAFLAYTEFADTGLYWDYSYPRSFQAEENVPGCAPLDMAMVAEDIVRARERADVVVVSFHWGLEDINFPQPFNPKNNLEAVARQAIDLGASLVLGTHPHAIQGLEAYHNGLIAYSLGNFVMDQKRDVQKESMILELQVGPSGVLSARVTPVWIDTTRPRVLEGAEAERLLEKIERISDVFRDHR